MPELRQNFFTKEWVIIATERAKRPEELATHRPAQTVPSFVESCPFCPGNESKTPPEVMRFPANAAQPWTVRVIPNKFAALSKETQPTRSLQDVWRRIEGFGFHEVIIDSPDHSCCMALLPDEQVANVLRVYKERYTLLSMDRRVNHVTIFKNHGVDAGASLQHPHSQLIATPVIPSQVRHRLHEALRHYDDDGKCMFCHMVEREIEEQTRIVQKSEHFVARRSSPRPRRLQLTSFPSATWPPSETSRQRRSPTSPASCAACWRRSMWGLKTLISISPSAVVLPTIPAPGTFTGM